MNIKVGQVYETTVGKVRVLAIDGNAQNGQLPVVVQKVKDGGICHLNKDGEFPGNSSWDLQVPKATGFINVWPTEAEALAHKKFAGQVTVPVEYEVKD